MTNEDEVDFLKKTIETAKATGGTVKIFDNEGNDRTNDKNSPKEGFFEITSKDGKIMVIPFEKTY